MYNNSHSPRETEMIAKVQAGEIIKNLRQMNNLTQDEFAEVLGVKKSSIQKYESGAVSNLKMQTIRTICEEFKISPYVLVFPEKMNDMETALRFHIGENDSKHLVNLNGEGIRKVLDYAKDLYDSGNYDRSNISEK